jgi:hypothetical protein
MQCSNCGKMVQTGDLFCASCGNAIRNAAHRSESGGVTSVPAGSAVRQASRCGSILRAHRYHRRRAPVSYNVYESQTVHRPAQPT